MIQRSATILFDIVKKKVIVVQVSDVVQGPLVSGQNALGDGKYILSQNSCMYIYIIPI